MIENYEEQKSIDGKQMDSMKREINELKELYNKGMFIFIIFIIREVI